MPPGARTRRSGAFYDLRATPRRSSTAPRTAQLITSSQSGVAGAMVGPRPVYWPTKWRFLLTSSAARGHQARPGGHCLSRRPILPTG